MATINAIGSNKPIEVGFGGTGQATLTNHAVLVGATTAAITQLAVGATNQVLLGNTGADPSWGTVGNAALTNSSITVSAGTGISVSGSPVSLGGTVTINAVGSGLTWSVISANQTAAVNNGYFCNKAGTLTLALPAVSAVGDVINVVNINTATGVQFTQAANQQIFASTASSTLGATGTMTSSAVGDTMRLVCRTANLVWWVESFVGNWTPA